MIRLILILVTLQSISALNLNSLKSLKTFFNSLAHEAENYHLNSSVTSLETKRILNQIFEDKNQIFDELSVVSSTLRYNLYKTEWTILMRSLVTNKIRGGMFDSYDLHTFEDELDALRKRIESSISVFKSLGRLEPEDNVEYFCNKGYPLANEFLKQLHRESVSDSFLNFIGIVREKMEALTNTQEVTPDHCGLSVSFRRALYDYYQLFMLVQVKFTALKFFNWATFIRCSDVVGLGTRWVDKEVNKAKKMIKGTKKILNEINYFIYTCEPLDYERKYENMDIELKMMKPVVIDEKNLTFTGDCDHRCDLNLIFHAQIYDECKDYTNCQYVSDYSDICRSDDQQKLNEYILEDISGHSAEYLNAGYQLDKGCGLCLCTCLLKPSKSRATAFSFLEQVTDISKNMVISAVQFVEKNQMIHIEVMENQLLPFGETELTSWKPIPDFEFNETTGEFIFPSQLRMIPGTDYGHSDTVNLDDLLAPPGFTLTGIRLRYANPMTSGPIQLEIRVTPFDYELGQLVNLEQTKWIIPEQVQRSELVLEKPDKPSKSSSNPPDSKERQFVKFKTSDYCKDSGASTVPYVNGQTVRFIPMTALGGVGIYHRGREGFGGYFALRIFDLNLSELMKSDITL